MKSPGFVIHNETIWPLEISLAQVGPLYWGVTKPGEQFVRGTGAVWFTIKAQVSLDGKGHIKVWDAIWPIASIVGSIAVGAITGGVGAFASAGAFAAEAGVISTGVASTLVAGGLPALEAIVVTGAAGGALATLPAGAAPKVLSAIFSKENATVSKAGCYAGPPWPFRASHVHEYRIHGGPTLVDRKDGTVALGPGALQID